MLVVRILGCYYGPIDKVVRYHSFEIKKGRGWLMPKDKSAVFSRIIRWLYKRSYRLIIIEICTITI